MLWLKVNTKDSDKQEIENVKFNVMLYLMKKVSKKSDQVHLTGWMPCLLLYIFAFFRFLFFFFLLVSLLLVS